MTKEAAVCLLSGGLDSATAAAIARSRRFDIYALSFDYGLSQLTTAFLVGAATILHNLRFMGNAAAHEMKAHSIQEISTALDIVEILLQNVYVLPKLAEVLPAANNRMERTRYG